MLLLASNSPRRQQILSLAGYSYRAIPAEVDESQLPGESPSDYVLRLSRAKVGAAVSAANSGWLVVAADTAVVAGGDILGKPRYASEAMQMLQRLRGEMHEVYTGLAISRPRERLLHTELCITKVWMRHYPDQEIEAYIASGDPFDKAGGYAIQNIGFNPVQRLEGCYANVVGLPLCHLTKILRQLDEIPDRQTRIACDDTDHYRCAIRDVVLN